MGIERELHDLLYTHDCVIVPGFGGFLTHYRPARLDEQRRLVHPPAKELSFNRQLVRQDGLLADALAKRQGLDFQAASAALVAEVEGWRARLDGQGRLEVGRIGTFFRDGERNLQFEPDKRVNFLKDAFGLRPVPAIPMTRIVPAKPQVQRTAPRPIPAKEEPRRSHTFLYAAATVAVLLTAATWFTLTSQGPGSMAWSSFDVFRSNEAPRYALPKAPQVQAAATARGNAWTAPAAGSGIGRYAIAGEEGPLVAVDLGQATLKAVPESTAVATRSVNAHYHVVGGCFEDKENADRFIAELQAKGFAASLIDRKGGLYRVAYGSYPLRTTALEALHAVRKEEAPDAWLLVK